MSIAHEYSEQRSKSVAYVLWFLIVVGIGGGQRFYTGKHISGLIYLVTGGFFGFGQLLDLILIPRMVDDFNVKQRLLYGNLAANQAVVNIKNPTPHELPGVTNSTNKVNTLVPQLLKLAQHKNGIITVTDGVISTGKTFKEVEQALTSIYKAGYASVENHPVSGVVIYRISQLEK